MTRLLPALTAALLAALALAVPTWAAFTFSGAWGTQGSGAGQFQGIDGVAVDPAGNVYVADTNNNRIQRFTADGAFLSQFGSAGAAAGQFNQPVDVAVGPDGSVYVADAGNNRLQRFTSEGGFISQWGTFGSLDGQFNAPTGVTTGPDGSVYVADLGNNRIQRFLADGTFFASFGTAGTANGQLSNPAGVSAGPDGTVYVADSGNERVQAFTADGGFVTAWGSAGFGDGQFAAAMRGISATAAGVYVQDGNGSVQRFTTGGSFLERLNADTSGDPQFNTPNRVAVTPSGQIYVTQGSARVGRYAQVSEGPAGGFDQLPPPETGETANVAPVNGTVKVKLPGSGRFVDLDKAAQIPIGSVVDVRKGEIALRTTAGAGAVQTANFFEGVFRLLQPKASTPTTELRLEGGNFKKSCRRFRVKPPPRSSAFAARKKVRRLWGNGSGKFRTKGRYSAASLRGTEWLTEDHCDGTLIRVKSGSVTVRDFVKRKNIVLTAGKSYFAKAKPAGKRR